MVEREVQRPNLKEVLSFVLEGRLSQCLSRRMILFYQQDLMEAENKFKRFHCKTFLGWGKIFFFFWEGVTHGMQKFPARDQNCTAGVTRATSMTILDPQPTEPPENSEESVYIPDINRFLMTKLMWSNQSDLQFLVPLNFIFKKAALYCKDIYCGASIIIRRDS